MLNVDDQYILAVSESSSQTMYKICGFLLLPFSDEGWSIYGDQDSFEYAFITGQMPVFIGQLRRLALVPVVGA